jgi:hypothetical protein
MWISVNIGKSGCNIKIVFHKNYFNKKKKRKINTIREIKFKKVKILKIHNEIIIKITEDKIKAFFLDKK